MENAVSGRIVVFPNYEGRESVSGEFSRRIRTAVGGVHIVAAINGVDSADEADVDVEHVYSTPGFNAAVLAGLARAVEPGALVARIDTNEHDRGKLPMAFSLLESADMAVLDMVFDETTLRAGSAEEYHTKFVIPQIISFATGQRWTLSGCHGFLVFRGEALARILPIVVEALRIANGVEEMAGRAAVTWSADTLLPIVADRLGMVIKIVPQDAVEFRDNESEKCALQAWDLQCLLHALDKILPGRHVVS
jgi:hypothetical protein